MLEKRLPHGEFGKWLDSEFEMSQPTARNFISVAKSFSDKMITVSNLSPKVLYLLASQSTPEEVREFVIEKSNNGDPMTLNSIKRLFHKAHSDFRCLRYRCFILLKIFYSIN